MASYRHIEPKSVLGATVTGDVDSTHLDLRTMNKVGVSIKYDAGLTTASFAVMGSIDGIDYGDFGVSIPDAAASATTLVFGFDTHGVNYFKIAITGVTGSGRVDIKMSAKGI